MEIFIKIFGEGKDLNAVQMSSRGVVVFIIALILIRLSGRRSFGLRTPLDNIIAVLLGAIMSRAVVGASDFVPVIICCFVIVLMHRLFGWFIATGKQFGRVVEGDKILLFENGHFIADNLKKALVCQEDVMQGVRKSALTEDMSKIKKVYMERNGDISAIKME
ncbi:MAG: YetF domain-containing protein [Bacteroidota bacterium]